MRNSNLVVRLSASERKEVDELQETYAVNISQYVRNKLSELHNAINKKGIETLVPLSLSVESMKAIDELKGEFNCDPINTLINAMDDDSIRDTIDSNIREIRKHHRAG